MTTVLLVRHGQSLSNLGLATTATAAVPVSEEGFKQAKEVAQQLKAHTEPDLIVHSPYLRAWQTAKPTINVFAYTPVEEWPVQEFTYLSAWRDEPTTVEQRREIVDLYWEIADPNMVDGPECESFRQFIKRVHRIKQRIKLSSYNKVVIFSHEQFITAFIWLLHNNVKKITPEKMKEFRAYLKKNPIPNGAIRSVRIRNRIRSTIPTKSVTSEASKKKESNFVPVGKVSVSESAVLLENATSSIQKPCASNAHATPQSAVVDHMHPPAQSPLNEDRGDLVPDSDYTFLHCLKGFGAMVKKLMW